MNSIRGSRRGRRARRMGALLGLGAVAVVTACAGHGTHRHSRGFRSDATTIQVLNTEIGGKKVFIPSTLVVTAGTPYTLSIYNSLPEPHGFAIAGLGIEEVVPSRKEFEVNLPALEGRRTYRIHCQLHSTHRTGTLVVLP